jgi:hypothetical protein
MLQMGIPTLVARGVVQQGLGCVAPEVVARVVMRDPAQASKFRKFVGITPTQFRSDMQSGDRLRYCYGGAAPGFAQALREVYPTYPEAVTVEETAGAAVD